MMNLIKLYPANGDLILEDLYKKDQREIMFWMYMTHTY